MNEPQICEYGPYEYDPKGFWIARCPKHPEHFQISIGASRVHPYHVVVEDDSEVSP